MFKLSPILQFHLPSNPSKYHNSQRNQVRRTLNQTKHVEMISNKWVKTAALLLMLVMAASFWIYKQNSLFHPHNLQCLHTKSEWLRIENSFLLLVILFHISSSQVAEKQVIFVFFKCFGHTCPLPPFLSLPRLSQIHEISLNGKNAPQMTSRALVPEH